MIHTITVSPEQLAAKAAGLVLRGIIGVAYTTTSRMSTSATAHERGLVNVLVTNETIEEAPWRALLPLIDAVNIDLKRFADTWYRKLGGDLGTVKRSIELTAEQCHVKMTTLLVPGENDNVEGIRTLARWLAGVNPNIPLHLSRLFPRHRMTDRPPTPVERVYQLADEARAYLAYVYTGNC